MKEKVILLLISLISLSVSAHKEKWDDNKESWSPLMHAIYNGQTTSFVRMVRQGADVNYRSKSSNWTLTALDIAIRKNDEVAVRVLLGTNKIVSPESYLMTASAQKSSRNIQLLINYGANPNETTDSGYSVLMSAASFGSTKILEMLLRYGAKPNFARKVDGITALMLAAFNGESEKVKILLKYNADKSIKDKNGKRALEYVDDIYDHLGVSESVKKELRILLK